MVQGESVYGEKRVSVEAGEAGEKIEYRVWNPFRSKLAAAILGGIDQIHIKPGSKVLYLGAASGTTVSHVSDVVGPVSIAPPVALSLFPDWLNNDTSSNSSICKLCFPWCIIPIKTNSKTIF